MNMTSADSSQPEIALYPLGEEDPSPSVIPGLTCPEPRIKSGAGFDSGTRNPDTWKLVIENCPLNIHLSLLSRLKLIQWADNPPPSPVEHVGVDHGGRDIGMAQQLLDGANIVTGR